MEESNEAKVLRCKASTDVNKLAGSIFSVIQESQERQLLLRVIGAGALNQAMKAVIISNKFFSKKGFVVGVEPYFEDSDKITVIVLRVVIRKI